MAKIIIGNVNCKLIGLLDEKILKKIDYELSYFVNGHQFIVGGHWDGRCRLFQKGAFPIGLLPKVCDILNKASIAYETVDNREPIAIGRSLQVTSGAFAERPYQKETISKAISAGGGIIKLATGGGKTYCLASIIAHYNANSVIYVIGTDLLYQMKSTFKKAFGIDIGMVGDGICDIKKITVATIWSAASAFNAKLKSIDADCKLETCNASSDDKRAIRDMVRGANVIILDECQYAGSDTFQFLHKESVSARHRYLFSATPWRESGDDILLEAVAGKKIIDISASELIRQGYLIRPEISMFELPDMKSIGKTYLEVYKNYVINNDHRNNLIVKAAIKLVDMGKKPLILITNMKHGERIQDMIGSSLRTEYLDGTNNIAERNLVISNIRSGSTDVIIASKIFTAGIDVPELDALIVACAGKSKTSTMQRIGRVIRPSGPDKKVATVIDFFDKAKYLTKHSQTRYQTYLSESEFKVKIRKM